MTRRIFFLPERDKPRLSGKTHRDIVKSVERRSSPAFASPSQVAANLQSVGTTVDDAAAAVRRFAGVPAHMTNEDLIRVASVPPVNYDAIKQARARLDAQLALTPDQRQEVLQLMHDAGGSFVAALSLAWQRADSVNSEKLMLTFSDIFANYQTLLTRINATKQTNTERL
jgi:hypothetical protein